MPWTCCTAETMSSKSLSPVYMKHTETGEHRHVRILGRAALTGPEADAFAQVVCFMSFLFAWIVWPVFTGVFVAETNPLLALVPFLTLLLASFSYLHCGFVDPGIVPPAKSEQSSGESNPIAASTTLTDECSIQPPENSPLWCKSCKIIREPGTYHCDICKVCVRELDHHCGVVGNCIGARNKASFLAVVIYSHTTITFGIVNLILGIINYSRSDLSLENSVAFQTVVWVIGGIELLTVLVCLSFLLAFHFGLGDFFPFSLMMSLCKTLFGKRFFTLMAPRVPNNRTLCGIYRCTVVGSLVTVHGPPRTAEAGENLVRRSEELPLTEV